MANPGLQFADPPATGCKLAAEPGDGGVRPRPAPRGSAAHAVRREGIPGSPGLSMQAADPLVGKRRSFLKPVAAGSAFTSASRSS